MKVMAYVPLNPPSNASGDISNFLRESVDPLLRDVHAMFRLPIAGDPGLVGGCNLTAALVLLQVVDGVAYRIWGDAGGSGPRFKKILVDHFPWSRSHNQSG